jgi:Na+-translocating ferredoxin:NAD+ oxidoreductase RnfC subunit
MCVNPEARSANINLGVLGLPVRQVILVEGEAEILDWATLTVKPAEATLRDKREMVISKLVERHSQTRERVMAGLVDVLPADVDGLLDQFDSCGACNACMDVCPICSVSYPHRAKDGRFERQDVAEWLVDCAGCGMCEQSCPKHIPLSIIFTYVKQNLESALLE